MSSKKEWERGILKGKIGEVIAASHFSDSDFIVEKTGIEQLAPHYAKYKNKSKIGSVPDNIPDFIITKRISEDKVYSFFLEVKFRGHLKDGKESELMYEWIWKYRQFLFEMNDLEKIIRNTCFDAAKMYDQNTKYNRLDDTMKYDWKNNIEKDVVNKYFIIYLIVKEPPSKNYEHVRIIYPHSLDSFTPAEFENKMKDEFGEGVFDKFNETYERVIKPVLNEFFDA